MSDLSAYVADLEAMGDAELEAEAARLRGARAGYDAAYAEIREGFASGKVELVDGKWSLVAPSLELLEKSQEDRAKLHLVEHCESRRRSKAGLMKYGSCPADWPVEGEPRPPARGGDGQRALDGVWCRWCDRCQTCGGYSAPGGQQELCRCPG